MEFIDPKTELLSVTYNDITYNVTYYKTAFTITGVAADTASNWAVGTTYGLGDYAIVPELKRLYRSALAGNIGVFPPSDSTKWIDYGNINAYAMFATDENIGGVTTITDGVLEFDFSRCDSIVGIDLNFSIARVYMFDTSGINYRSTYDVLSTYAINDGCFYNLKYYVSNTAGNIGNTPDVSPEWDETPMSYANNLISGKDIGCLSFSDYFYTDLALRTRYILTGLEWLSSSVIRIELDNTSTIGTITYGIIKPFGATMEGVKLRYESTSKFTINEYNGYRNIIRYGKTRILDVKVMYDAVDFDIISQRADSLIDKNIVWVPTQDDKFTDLITLGYIERFEVDINGFDKNVSPATIIGVNK